MVKKPVIFYIDDKDKWLNGFFMNHHKDFDIERFTKDTDFRKRLADVQGTENQPDIILIDLFHPKENRSQTEQKAAEIKGQAAIDRLDATIDEVKQPIYYAWEPYGFNMLQFARKLYPETPIAIYTQQGLSVVGDDKLAEVSKLRGEWLLKGRDKTYESYKLQNMLEQTNESDRLRKELEVSELKMRRSKKINSIALGILAAIIIALGIYAWIVNNDVYQFITLLVVPLLVVCVPIFISRLEKAQENKGD